MDGVKKKYSAAADIANWYGVNPFELTGGQRAGLIANLPRVKAQRTIYEGKLDGFDHQGIYDLFLTAYNDEEIATDARTQFLEKLVEAQCNAANQASRG